MVALRVERAVMEMVACEEVEMVALKVE